MTLHAVYWLLAALCAYVAVGLGMALHALDRILQRLDQVAGKAPRRAIQQPEQPEVEEHHREPVYVVAGNATEAENYARKKGLRRGEYRYVSDRDVLFGKFPATIVFTGTWHDRADATDVWQYASYGGYHDIVEDSL